MSLPRVFAPQAKQSEQLLSIHGDEARHMLKVMRLKQGDKVNVFNGQGGEWEGEIEGIKAGRALVRLGEMKTVTRDLEFELVLATAVPKGSRLDWLVEKAAELGVTTFIPIRHALTFIDL